MHEYKWIMLKYLTYLFMRKEYLVIIFYYLKHLVTHVNIVYSTSIVNNIGGGPTVATSMVLEESPDGMLYYCITNYYIITITMIIVIVIFVLILSCFDMFLV